MKFFAALTFALATETLEERFADLRRAANVVGCKIVASAGARAGAASMRVLKSA